MDSEKNTAAGRKNLLRRHAKRTLRYVRTFVLWAAAGLVIGALGGLIGTAFCYAIREATQLRGAYPWLLYFLPAGGLLIVWLYRLRGMHPTDTNGVLLDGTEKMTPQTGRDIYIEGGRIGAVADAAARREGYEVVDLGGQYVLPGLINLHVHLPASGKPKKKASDPKKLVKLITANALTRRIGVKLCEGYAKTELLSGVTTIRTVGGVADFDTIIRDLAAQGKILSPRVVASNMAVSVPGGHMAGSLAYEAKTPEEAEAYVERNAAEEPDPIQLMIAGGGPDAEVARQPATWG